MTDEAWLSATEAASLFRRRALSPVDLVRSLIDRIDRHDAAIGSVLRLDRKGALLAAGEAARELAAGHDRGPLHGVPVGIKDVIDVAGLPTTCHSRLGSREPAAADAAVVGRLRAAGAIMLAKVATHEFAIGGPSFDLPFPPARNPWNLERHPGGSSSGSGAGLAAGFFPLALGTDTGGSIRHPAGACGIVGLKPTGGRVPCDGVFPVSWSLDTVGPMARSAEDAALLFAAMTGGVSPAPPEGASLAGLRVGFVRDFHERDVEADGEVTAALNEAAATLGEAGARVTPAALPPLGAFAAANRVILTAEGWSVHATDLRERPEAYGELSRRRLLVGAFLSAEDLLAAQRRRGELARAVEDVFASHDVLLVANAMDPACRIDDRAAIDRNYGRQARIPFSLTGHPAVAVPVGFSSDGLPLSCQFVAPHGQDERALAVAIAFQRITGWHRRHPVLS